MDRFCGTCGSPLEESTGRCPQCQPKKRPRSASFLPKLAIAVAIVVVVTVLVLAAFLLGSSSANRGDRDSAVTTTTAADTTATTTATTATASQTPTTALSDEAAAAVSGQTQPVMTSYIGKMVQQITEVFGSDYYLDPYWEAGNLKSICYEDFRTAMSFYYMDPNLTGQCTGVETIYMVSYAVRPGDAPYPVDDVATTAMTYTQLASKTSGELYEDELRGGYTYTYERGGYSVNFHWESGYVEEPPVTVEVVPTS